MASVVILNEGVGLANPFHWTSTTMAPPTPPEPIIAPPREDQAETDSNAPQNTPGQPTDAFKKWYLLAAVAVVAISYYVMKQVDQETSIGFLLAAFSLLLNGFAILYPGKFAQKALLVISLVLCSAGAFTFVQSLKAAKAGGPRLYDVTFTFNAVQYSVTGLSDMPCTQSDPNHPQAVICAVRVEPLAPKSESPKSAHEVSATHPVAPTD